MFINTRTSVAAGGLLALAVGYSMSRKARRNSVTGDNNPKLSGTSDDSKDNATLSNETEITVPSPIGGSTSGSDAERKAGPLTEDFDNELAANSTQPRQQPESSEPVNSEQPGSEYRKPASEAPRHDTEPNSLDLAALSFGDFDAKSIFRIEASAPANTATGEAADYDGGSEDAGHTQKGGTLPLLEYDEIAGHDAAREAKVDELGTR